jgi:hypothetical protein
MSPDFEWVSSLVENDDGDCKVRVHWLIDPMGEVRADIEEPVKGRISYCAELYWKEGLTRWISLDLAKLHVESRYRNLLANNFRKKRRARRYGVQETESRRPGRRPFEKGNGFPGLPS